MTFISTLPTWAWILVGMVPLGIIALYFLKLRREPRLVPSTLLWQRTIEDIHVNSLIQRLRNNLLLLLQLLFVGILVLALLRPGLQDESRVARRLIFLLDTSASMQAADGTGGQSRFQMAVAKIAEQIDAMDGNDVGMLIAFSDRAEILQEFTADRRRLRDALTTAKVTSRTTDMLEALRAAAGLANPNRSSQASDANDVQVADALPADLWIYSDGGFHSVADFNLGNLTPHFVSIGESSSRNLAITAFSAERTSEDSDAVQVFARVQNFSPVSSTTAASLYVVDELVDAQSVTLEPGEEAALTFELTSTSASQLRLALDADDDFTLDNTAHAGIAPPRRVSVLVLTDGNQALELALATDQVEQYADVVIKATDYLNTDEYRQRAALGRDDLIVFDNCTPETMPAANTFFIGAVPPQDWQAGELQGPVLPIDIDRTHPVMRYLELFSLNIVEGRALQAPRGGTSLITADIGPVVALASRGGYQDLIVGFEIISRSDEGNAFNTDWPIQRSWPVFIFNVVRFLGGAAELTTAASILPGEVIALRVDNRLKTVRMKSPPNSIAKDLTVNESGQIAFSDTEQLGLYEVVSPTDETTLVRFAVNLFDPRESNLAPAADIELGYETVSSQAPSIVSRGEYWRWLLLGALGILCCEWILFNRRLL